MENDPLLSVSQAALLLKIHPLTVRRYIKDGKLHAVRAGGNIRILQSDLDGFMKDIFPTTFGIKEKSSVQKDTVKVFDINDPIFRMKGKGSSLKPLSI